MSKTRACTVCGDDHTHDSFHPFIEAHCICGLPFDEALNNDCWEPCRDLDFHRHDGFRSGVRVFLDIEDRIAAADALDADAEKFVAAPHIRGEFTKRQLLETLIAKVDAIEALLTEAPPPWFLVTEPMPNPNLPLPPFTQTAPRGPFIPSTTTNTYHYARPSR